ncbi:MAG: HTH domain-containing protein [Clostridia bacterium]|nr:HTH domain-containing protein [Clostridia bacterium]
MKTTQNKTLLDLLKNTTDYLSGEKIAQTLGVSRNAVWKQISLLKKDGYQITAVKIRVIFCKTRGKY